jgi:hypothetical protein
MTPRSISTTVQERTDQTQLTGGATSLAPLLAITQEAWGVQYIPDGNSYVRAGYVANIGTQFFWAASLEAAIDQALAWRKEHSGRNPDLLLEAAGGEL